MKTQAFEEFISPARSYPQFWRLFLGTILMVVVYVACLAAIFVGILVIGGADTLETWLEQMISPEKPTVVMVLLFSFTGMALAPIAAARLLHKRKTKTLLGPLQLLVKDFLKALAVTISFFGVLTLFWSIFFDAVPNIEFTIWISFLPLAVVGLLIQTGAEELVFRGYIMQQLAVRFRSPLIWMILPSVAFGIVHFDPSLPGGTMAYVLVSATAFGLIAADLVRITGNLGAAWGVHFANNAFAMLFLSVPDGIPGMARYLTPYTTNQVAQNLWLVAADIVVLIIVWQILRRILRA